MEKYEFEAVIKQNDGKDAGYIEVPLDIEKEFGTKRVKVKALFDNKEYRGSIVKMGLPCYIIGVTKEMRNKIGKTFGDVIEVVLEKDEEERVVEILEDLKVKLDNNKEALDFYEGLSYSMKKKYIQWITSAKKEETRAKRIDEAITKLSNKEKI